MYKWKQSRKDFSMNFICMAIGYRSTHVVSSEPQNSLQIDVHPTNIDSTLW